MKTVKVKVLQSIATVNGNLETGQEVEMFAHEAEVFADCKAVEILKTPEQVEAEAKAKAEEAKNKK